MQLDEHFAMDVVVCGRTSLVAMFVYMSSKKRSVLHIEHSKSKKHY